MKKILTVIMTILLLLSITACASAKPETPEQPETPQQQPEPQQQQPEPEQSPDKFSRGSWNASKTEFTNLYTGIKITLPSSYSVRSDSELVSLYMDKKADLSQWGDKEYAEELNIPDCAFYNPETGCNTGILYENLAAEDAAEITDDLYIMVVRKNMSSSLENLKTSDTFVLILSDQIYKAFDLNYLSNGTEVFQTLAVRKVGNYMTIIVFTEFAGYPAIEEMISFFD